MYVSRAAAFWPADLTMYCGILRAPISAINDFKFPFLTIFIFVRVFDIFDFIEHKLIMIVIPLGIR